MKSLQLLFASLFLTNSALASVQPADLFACARALADQPDGAQQMIEIAPVPGASHKPLALFIPIGRLPQRNGQQASEFVLLTRGEMSCHRLPRPVVDHAAGSVTHSFPFRWEISQFHILPKGKLEFAYVTQRDNETRRLTSSKLTRLENDSEPLVLRRRSCLDPEGLETKRLLAKLAHALRERTKALDDEQAARSDIRRQNGDGPGPAFLPARELGFDTKDLSACQRIDDKGLNEALERYHHSLHRLQGNKITREKKTGHGGSLR